MSAGKLARNEAWNCVLASCAWHPRTWACTSCPADNKIWLLNKSYMNVCGNTCASFMAYLNCANWRRNEAWNCVLASCARHPRTGRHKLSRRQ